MRLGLPLVVLAMILAATGSRAQDQLTPGAFLDQAEGRTLTFHDYRSGALVGVEQFLSRRQSVWTRSDGTCTYGEITTTEVYVCFLYDDDPGRQHCWVPFSYKGQLMVRSPGGDLQEITGISDRPVACIDAPMS